MPERPAPIAVFAHDRPQHLAWALESLERSEGFDRHPLYIFCDAPASPASAAGAAAVREVAARWASGRGASVILRESNLRFGNLTEGISRLCAEHGRVIVVEDDIVVSPDFLPFMREGLDRYADEPRVYLVSGYMHDGAHPSEPQCFFLPWAFVWGWATWQRAWARYRPDAPGWEQLLADPARRERFDPGGGLKYAKMLERTMRGELVTWDIQWSYAVFTDDAVGLHPWRSLTFNTGFGTGVHMEGSTPSRTARAGVSAQDFERPRLSRPFVFPSAIVPDEASIRRLAERLASRRGGWRGRVRRALGLGPRGMR